MLCAICTGLIPAVCNAVLFIATDTEVSLQMTGGVALCLHVLVCLDNKIRAERSIKRPVGLRAIMGLVLALILWGNIYQVEFDQNAMEEGYQASMSITERIIDHLDESGYLGTDTPLCLAGRTAENPMFRVTDAFQKANAYARFGEWYDVNAGCFRQSWQGMLWLNAGVNVTLCTDDEYDTITAKEIVQEMPCFPAEGSMRMDDGILVIKISDVY